MPNNRISKDKRVFILAALSEGTPINAVCRMFKVGKHGVLRVIAETGEALTDYMDSNFRDIPCARVAMDEQWQYVGQHGVRMQKRELERGDFWLWAAIDPDTKLVFSHVIGHRDKWTCESFVKDTASRVSGPVQLASDAWGAYARHIPQYFKQEGMSYGTETKIFNDPFRPETFSGRRKNGVQKIVTVEREAAIGNPDLSTATTCHIERFFLTMRQELKRFQRMGLGYSKDLDMHKAATALHIGLYNLVRKHSALDGRTPAQTACLEDKRWSLEDVVELTEAFMRGKEDAKFEAAL
jgi:IS1 family transposase